MECAGLRGKYVIGPDGSPLTVTDLPSAGTKRWVIRRKAEVVAAVRGGLLFSRKPVAAMRSRSKNTSPGSILSIATATLACVPRGSSSTGTNNPKP